VQGGTKAGFDAGQVLRRRLTISGSTLRPRSLAFKAGIARALRKSVWPLLEERRIRPVIYRELSADRAAEAHALMESGEHVGKIVLSWAKE
jgi:NADPH2:quinone reductase